MLADNLKSKQTITTDLTNLINTFKCPGFIYEPTDTPNWYNSSILFQNNIIQNIYDSDINIFIQQLYLQSVYPLTFIVNNIFKSTLLILSVRIKKKYQISTPDNLTGVCLSIQNSTNTNTDIIYQNKYDLLNTTDYVDIVATFMSSIYDTFNVNIGYINGLSYSQEPGYIYCYNWSIYPYNNESILLSDLNIEGNLVCDKSLTVGSNLFINNNAVIKGSLSCISDIYINHNAIINGDITIQSDLNLSNDLICNNNTTNELVVNNLTSFLSNLYVSGTAWIQNKLIVNNLIGQGDILTLNSNVINIGNSDSTVNIIGEKTIINSDIVDIQNKTITLNIDRNNQDQGAGIGDLCGIEILGLDSTTNGYIKTNETATRYYIKAPLGDKQYIGTLDLNNNLIVSGTSILYDNLTVLSQLNVSNYTYLNNTIIKSDLNVSQTTSIQNNCIVNNLQVSNKSILQTNYRSSYRM